MSAFDSSRRWVGKARASAKTNKVPFLLCFVQKGAVVSVMHHAHEHINLANTIMESTGRTSTCHPTLKNGKPVLCASCIMPMNISVSHPMKLGVYTYTGKCSKFHLTVFKFVLSCVYSQSHSYHLNAMHKCLNF